MNFSDYSGHTGPRAEEVVAEVYRQLSALREEGRIARRLVICPDLWTRIIEYRKKLGTLESSLPDYLNEDSLFGLEIWYGRKTEVRVE